MTVEAGMAARSLAGHDKGHWYLVLSEEGGYAYLIDGQNRTAARPKKKNKIHLQPARGTVDAAGMDAGAVKAYLKEFYRKDQEEKRSCRKQMS